MPIEWVWEHGAGPEDGDRFALELAPRVTFALGEDWLLLSRSIVPLLVHQQALVVERTPDDPTWSMTFTIDLLFERPGR